METREPWGGWIVIDPDDLRDVAVRLRRAAVTYSSVAQRLAKRPLPVMPAHVAPTVAEAISRVHKELQELALELLDEAASLAAKATWAELGESGEPAWLIPGLRHLPSVTDIASARTDATASASERAAVTEEWALKLLDEMKKLVEETNDPSGENSLASWVGEWEGSVDEYAGGVPDNNLDPFTLLADLPTSATDLGDVTLDAAEGEAGRTAARGALATGSAVFSAALTGAGISGCLLVGGGLDFFDEIHTGENVFDE